MGIESFHQVADLLPETMLLLTADGTILAANRSAEDRLGLARHGLPRPMADIVADAPATIDPYLHACARSRQLVLGSFTLKTKDGEALACRSEGAVFRPRSAAEPALVLLRLTPKEAAIGQFTALNQRITELAREIARRKQVEAALEEKNESLQVTLTSIGDAVIVTDAAGRVSFLNPVAERLTGWHPHEAAGQPLEVVFRIINEETRQLVENPVSKVLRHGATVGLANRTVLIARDGRELPIDDSAAPIRRDAGTIAGVVLVFRDVTETRRALEARLHLAAIVESSDDAIIGKDLNGIIVSWNRAAERLYGYTAAQVVGKPLALLVPSDHADELPALMERIKRGERISHYETVRLCKDGRQLEVSLTISPIHNSEGTIIGASKIARDISAAKRNERTLRFLADASAALATLVDYESTLQKVAQLAVPFFADWCTVDMAEADGSLRRLVVAHADPAKLALAQELQRRFPPPANATHGAPRVLRTGRAELLEEIPDAVLADAAQDEEHLRSLRALGLKSYIGVPLRARGKPLGVISFLRAGPGSRYDAHQLAVAEDLAHRVAVAIENALYYQELQDADRRKNEFLATLAHELRNPLAPVRNGLQIMRLAGINPETFEQTREMMDRQLQHMVRLIDDLLDVSRITRGKIELRKERVDLTSVIQSALEASRSLIESSGHSLKVTLPPAPLPVNVDPVRLVQVVNNILNNAARYTPQNGRIWLSAAREGKDAVLRVRDNGLGIPAEMLPRIFEMFTQVNRRLERSHGGLGIGLALVQSLVRLHGGTVEAHSAGLDQGSEFTVRLPLAPPEKPGADAVDEGGHATAAATLPRRRILVVDDNVDAAETLALLLRMMQNEVRVAHDGPAALTLAQQMRPDLIILDIGLPGMSGYEVARQLRALPQFQGVTIVALTGWGQPEDRRRSQEAGFDEHLVKPVDPEALNRVLAQPRRQSD